ncbi:HIT domain-containing protein [Luteimonas sp. e5]
MSAAPDFRLDPRLGADSHALAEWPLCTLRLMDDAQYPWLLLVPRIARARELIDLQPAQRRQLHVETDAAAQLLRDVFAPHKLNVAALGNVVEQLHVHVIARFREDPAWPRPVWGAAPMQRRSEAERGELIQRLQARLPQLTAD